MVGTYSAGSSPVGDGFVTYLYPRPNDMEHEPTVQLHQYLGHQ
jgi:hypothetical protein